MSLPAELHIALHAHGACGASEPYSWTHCSSVDGAKRTSPVVSGCESPASSSCSLRGPSCTGGGHGEAPPSATGDNQAPQRNPSPLGRSSCSSSQLHSALSNATATPLARHVAARSLRTPGRPRTQDTGPASASASSSVSLPSISVGGNSRRESLVQHEARQTGLQVQGTAQGQDKAQGQAQQALGLAEAVEMGSGSASPSHPVTPPNPRPPARAARTSAVDPSPRSRRATTTLESADAATVAAAAAAAVFGPNPFIGNNAAAAVVAAAAGTGACTIPGPAVTDVPARVEPPRFTRLQSMPMGARGQRFQPGATPEHLRYSLQAEHRVGMLGSSSLPPNHPAHHVAHTGRASGLLSPTQSPSPLSSPLIHSGDIPQLPLPLPLGMQIGGRGAGSSTSIQLRSTSASVDGVGADGVPSQLPSPSAVNQGTQSPSPSRRVTLSPSAIAAAPVAPTAPRLPAAGGHARAPPHHHIATTPEQRRCSSDMERPDSVNSVASSTSLRPPETPRPAHKPVEEVISKQSPLTPVTVSVMSIAANATPAAAESPASHTGRQQPPAPLRVGDKSSCNGGSGSGPSPTPVSSPTTGPKPAPAPTPGFSRLCSFQPSPSPRAAPPADPNAISSTGALTPVAEPASCSAEPLPRPAHPEPSSPPSSPSRSRSAASATSSHPSTPSPSPASTASVAPPTLAAVTAATAAPPPPAPRPMLRVPGVPALIALAEVGSFVPLPTPEDGLLHLHRNAPAGMLARKDAKWGVADFKVMRKLYAGYASSVYRAACIHTGTDVVLKAYNLAGLSTFLRHQVLRELHIHSKLEVPAVVQLLAAFKEGDLLVLVQEYVRGGSLDRLRRRLGGRLSEFQARHLVLRPLLAVLAHMHGRGIMHRDIKPENLLFTEGWQLKVCDFGVSVCVSEERPVTRTGSREYMAPEVSVCPLKRGPGDGKDDPSLVYGPGVDVWSVGALTYELLVGFTPFPGGPPQRRAAGEGEAAAAELAFPAAVSQSARAFVRACLQPDPADRPTVQQLLQHAWVQDSSPETKSVSSS